MKTKYTFYNSVTNLIYYFITILLGIITRRTVIQILGIQYQGIDGLFNNVLSMLNIAELGIGTAIIYHLYEPLRVKNIDTIKALMQFYKKSYRTIALIVLGLGLLAVPFLKYIVTNNTTDYPLALIYIWFLADTVVSYLFTYKRSILIADQKNYVVTLCNILYQFLVKIGQVSILIITKNFICYLVIMVFARLIENILINSIANYKYPYLKEKQVQHLPSPILKDIKEKVSGAFCHKIGTFVVLGTDNILISRFLGLAVVGIYSNYFLVINAIQNICSQVLTAATASVGHMLTEKNCEKNFRIFNELQILNGGMVNCASAGIYCVATPFIAAVFGEKFTVSEFCIFVLALNFYVRGMRTVYSIFKDTAGILYEDRFIPIIESLVNIVVSIIFIHFFGLAGVFIGTITSSILLYVYTYPKFVYKKVLHHSIPEYYKNLLWLISIAMISMILSKTLCQMITYENLILQIFSNCIIVLIVSNALYFLGYALWKPELKDLWDKISVLVKR